ncbi:hypothetical protein QB607_003073 [Clostridium botulinum]|nr:hypothetical protein [Clostridium botulinum]EKS4395746.1 hypothetical protein [Clostridium botulinum]
MKFKIGDKVQVRTDLRISKKYNNIVFVTGMEKYKGIETIIIGINHYGDYLLKNMGNYYFNTEMLNSVQEEFTFKEVIARIKPNETYESVDDYFKLESIHIDKDYNINLQYVENNSIKELLLDDTVYIDSKQRFKLKEFKKSFTFYFVEHKQDGNQYKFRSDDKLTKGDFVICDTKFGKTYGKVIKIKLIEISHANFEALQVFEEDYKQNYKKCWKA